MRRHFLQAAGAGLIACGLKIGNVAGASKNKIKFKVLDKDDQFDIGDRGKDIIQKRMILVLSMKKNTAAVHVVRLLHCRTPLTSSRKMKDYSEPRAVWMVAQPLQK